MDKDKPELDEKTEAKLKSLAKQIKDTVVSEAKKELGLDKALEKLTKIADSLTKKQEDLVYKVFVSEDTKKDVNDLSKKEKLKAFCIAMIRGDGEAVKALSEGVAADGGNLVPQEFYNQLVIERADIVSMRNEVKIVPVKKNVLTIAKHDTGPEVYWTAENVAKTTTTMDFSQPTITVYKLAAIIYTSDELLEDSAFSLINIIIQKFNEKIEEAVERAILQGPGVTQPIGIFTAGTITTTACVGNLSFDNLINLVYDLPRQYRKGAKWIVHNNNVRELRKLKDNDGRYIWVDSVTAGTPASILSYPVIETYDCGEDEIGFGDWKECYWIADRQRMTVKVTNDTETTFTKDQTAVRVVERIGGNVIVPNAARILNTIP